MQDRNSLFKIVFILTLQPEMFGAPNYIMVYLSKAELSSKYDLSSVRYMFTFGATVDKAIVKDILSKYSHVKDLYVVSSIVCVYVFDRLLSSFIYLCCSNPWYAFALIIILKNMVPKQFEYSVNSNNR